MNHLQVPLKVYSPSVQRDNMAVTLASLQAQFAMVETQMALYKTMLHQYASAVTGTDAMPQPVVAAPAVKPTKGKKVAASWKKVPATWASDDSVEFGDKPKRTMSDTTRLALKAAAAFNDMLVDREADAFAAYSEAQKALPKEERDGVNLKACFAKKYKESHKDEYDAFVSQYKDSHSSAAVSDDDSAAAVSAAAPAVAAAAAAAASDPVVAVAAAAAEPVVAAAAAAAASAAASEPVVAVAVAEPAPKPKLKIKAKAKSQPKPAPAADFVSTQRMTHNGQEVIVDATGNMYKDEGDMGPGEFMGIYNRSTGVLDTKAKEVM